MFGGCWIVYLCCVSEGGETGAAGILSPSGSQNRIIGHVPTHKTVGIKANICKMLNYPFKILFKWGHRAVGYYVHIDKTWKWLKWNVNLFVQSEFSPVLCPYFCLLSPLKFNFKPLHPVFFLCLFFSLPGSPERSLPQLATNLKRVAGRDILSFCSFSLKRRKRKKWVERWDH